MNKRKVHDGIVGAVVAAGVALGYFVNPVWLLVPGILGLVLLQSGVTGFCPLYYTLDKCSCGKGKPESTADNK